MLISLNRTETSRLSIEKVNYMGSLEKRFVTFLRTRISNNSLKASRDNS
jgi:hypothetical protein